MALNVLLDSKCKFFEQKESKQFKTYRLGLFYIYKALILLIYSWIAVNYILVSQQKIKPAH